MKDLFELAEQRFALSAYSGGIGFWAEFMTLDEARGFKEAVEREYGMGGIHVLKQGIHPTVLVRW